MGIKTSETWWISWFSSQINWFEDIPLLYNTEYIVEYIYIYIYILEYIYIYICICVSVCVCVCVCARAHVCECTCTYSRVWSSLCFCVSFSSYSRMYITVNENVWWYRMRKGERYFLRFFFFLFFFFHIYFQSCIAYKYLNWEFTFNHLVLRIKNRNITQ